ncbi:MAG: hypothetical protein EOM21_19020 [Gammaproteobacteria bacterium]|nr:hypothetical protein [Gammaproteobacteria bacterium]
MGDPSNRPEGALTTSELVAAIAREFGDIYSNQTIRNWAARPEDKHPLPMVAKGKAGQAHLYDWVEFLTWFEAEKERQERAVASVAQPQTGADPAAPNIDALDWHAARTVSAREQAKRDILITAQLEAKVGDLETMARVAEDRARLAVQQLLAIPSRISPRLVNIADELVIDRLLDAEIRAVCQQIERDANAAIAADDEPEPEAAAA